MGPNYEERNEAWKGVNDDRDAVLKARYGDLDDLGPARYGPEKEVKFQFALEQGEVLKDQAVCSSVCGSDGGDIELEYEISNEAWKGGGRRPGRCPQGEAWRPGRRGPRQVRSE